MKPRPKRRPGAAGTKGSGMLGSGSRGPGSGGVEGDSGRAANAAGEVAQIESVEITRDDVPATPVVKVAPNVLALRPPRPTGPIVLPPTLGQFLRKHRDLAKKTLVEVSRVTRIPERTLKKLEMDESEGLPADVFLRGYLRLIARVCSFDGDEALRCFESGRTDTRANAERVARFAAQAKAAAAAPAPRLTMPGLNQGDDKGMPRKERSSGGSGLRLGAVAVIVLVALAVAGLTVALIALRLHYHHLAR